MEAGAYASDLDPPRVLDAIAAPTFAVTPGELAAYRLTRMRGAGRVPGAGISTCPMELVIGRAAAALGRSEALRRFRLEVLGARRVEPLAPVQARRPVLAEARVEQASASAGATALTLAVRLRHADAAADLGRFLLDVVLRPR